MVIALLLSVLSTAVRVTQLMSLPCSKIFGPFLPHARGVNYCYCLSTRNPSFYTWFYIAGSGPLCQLAPIWARPVEGDRGRWHHWRRERELLLPVLFSVGSPSACSSCEWHPSPASSPWQWQFLPEAAVKSTLQLFPYSRTYLIVLPHGHQIQLPLPPIVAWTLAAWNPPSSEFPNFNSLLFVTLEIASYRSF